jgi:hypothetical protein
VPNDDPRTWQEAIASQRERLRQLERESDRQRDVLHALRAETQSVRFLTEKIAELASDVRDLAGKFESSTRRAVQRPSQSALAVFGQYVGLAVAIVALILAAR